MPVDDHMMGAKVKLGLLTVLLVSLAWGEGLVKRAGHPTQQCLNTGIGLIV